MPNLTYNMEQMPAGGSNQIRRGFVLLDGENAIRVHDMWSVHQLRKERPDSRLLGVHAYSDRDPAENVAVLREVIQRHEAEYISPDLPSSGQSDVWYKGVVVSKAEGRTDYELRYFLDEGKSDLFLTPDVVEVRVNTPNGDYVVDFQPNDYEERNQVSVLSHRNISELEAQLLIQTASILLPRQDLKGRLKEIFDEIMGDNYPLPEKSK